MAFALANGGHGGIVGIDDLAVEQGLALGEASRLVCDPLMGLESGPELGVQARPLVLRPRRRAVQARLDDTRQRQDLLSPCIFTLERERMNERVNRDVIDRGSRGRWRPWESVGRHVPSDPSAHSCQGHQSPHPTRSGVSGGVSHAPGPHVRRDRCRQSALRDRAAAHGGGVARGE